MLLDEDARIKLSEYLVVSEGLRLKPYADTEGKISIGVGRNLTDTGISLLEAHDLLNHDLDRAEALVSVRYPWIEDHEPARRAALVELMFNLGPKGLGLFVNTLKAFRLKDYPAAADGLKNSKWYTQVQHSRSARIIQMILTGGFP